MLPLQVRVDLIVITMKEVNTHCQELQKLSGYKLKQMVIIIRRFSNLRILANLPAGIDR